MAEYSTKKYYYIKLFDGFLTSDNIDFLMSQKNGSNYVVLYQMLCLKTVNNDGVLGRQLGEILVPYDVEKIQRDTKYFSLDTVRVALELYKKLGLIYELNNGLYRITDFERMVGFHTEGALKKQEQRSLAAGGRKVDKGVDKIPPSQEIEIDIEKDINKECVPISNTKFTENTAQAVPLPPPALNFTAPTLEEVEAYKQSTNSPVPAKRFYDYYAARGWKIKGDDIRDWKALFDSWAKLERPAMADGKPIKRAVIGEDIERHEYTDEQLASLLTKLDEEE